MSTKIIARNSLWYGVETVIGLVSGLFTTIAIARVLGPEKLGPFVYVGWLTSVAASLGGLGIPAATSKYMGEYLGRGELGIARAMFFLTLRLQTILAVCLTALGLSAVFLIADPSKVVFAGLLTASILPMMINFIPAQANAASEDLWANVPASIASTLVYVCGVILVLTFSWGLRGLAANVLLMRLVDLIVRFVPAYRRLSKLPSDIVPIEVRSKLFIFARQNVVLLFLSAIVWDRSEMFFLQYFSDVRQLAFYSVVINITERLRLVPQIFGNALNPTIMAQYGRDANRLTGMVSTALRYLGLVILPVNVGIAVLSAPFIRLTYGAKYLEAIPLMAFASLLAIPKALLSPVSSFLGATENQHIVVRWTLVVAVVNVALDLWLIPTGGAFGAVIANGVAQIVIALLLFLHAAKLLAIRLPIRSLAKITLSTAVMAGAVCLVPLTRWTPIVALLIGTAIAAIVLLLMLRVTRSIEPRDLERFQSARRRIPDKLGSWLDRGLALLIPSPALGR